MFDKIAEKAIPEILKISGVKDLINAIIEIYFGEPIMHAKILKISRDFEVESFKEMLYSNVNNISNENLHNPIGSEQEPLLFTSFDLLNNSISSEHYRRLFSNLIASAFDKTKYPKLHPSFPFIIQQLTPLDAKILLDISKNETSYTFKIGYTYTFTKTDKKISNHFYDFYLIENENNDYEDLELTNISINNLVKQGLIQLIRITDYDLVSQINNYNKDKFANLMSSIMNPGEDVQGGGSSGPLSEIIITQLGKSFLDTCL